MLIEEGVFHAGSHEVVGSLGAAAVRRAALQIDELPQLVGAVVL